MQHFPVFLNLAGRRVVLSGGGEAAVAKLRLLLKTEASLTVHAAAPDPWIEGQAAAGRLRIVRRPLGPGDCLCAALFYAADEDAAEDRRTIALARADGALVNVVDDLENSQFITPAIVDRDPVTVAIGTEGAAPVLARRIKADLEARLPARLGPLARIGKTFRKAAEALPMGRARRAFWAEYYDRTGPALPDAEEATVRPALDALLEKHLAAAPERGRVTFVGAGPGDPDLLTLAARRALDEADVVLHDRLVPQPILELARREAVIVETGKTGFGPAMSQPEIDALIVGHAAKGAQVVRLKSGDPGIYGRLDEELSACEAAGVETRIVPGITSAQAAAAALGQSLTARGRNADLRIVTGHDARGYTDQDWRALAAPGAVAAIYMGKRAARFIQGRLLMHGAGPGTPVTAVENASRPDQRVHAATLATLSETLVGIAGPAVLLLGLAPREAGAPSRRSVTQTPSLEAL
ncbi:uroporphyrin-III C-methyltransferase/precorrin-2 dehydrogenase/sirohydrochlorin ferrochelatase [Hasllibacter halocynthiae]|uniref:Uroporphyrin-III C-methyltransferase/precorrin-2 dehydrogenase/sirohydrochlorin ferrochelatase n=1 Tax=Hasllibacter halocynthiae TaxID=595589 RepID=A0A2T0X8U1_9RHOB|nr:siroheme synthase CysG [Hasllibacter halocynthiae]PRY95284.1 uroporphyrin-III C-methyltransferase/precorrin-2 dehydrogenase/sirohydrochlorin ferrochelatase [Hasllibacter halocynthiae]